MYSYPSLQPDSAKTSKFILENVLAFPPNRDTLGGTAYLIVRNEGNILLDCPAWDENHQNLLQTLGGVRWLFITHRGGISKASEIQAFFNCEVVIQEQEAYLLPGIKLTTFRQEFSLSSYIQTIWTPGHSPGSSCLYSSDEGGILFSGRHLLPNQLGEVVPLRTVKTFHWVRQLKSVQLLLDRFAPDIQYIFPGANTGFLRGKVIDQAYQRLANLNLAKTID